MAQPSKVLHLYVEVRSLGDQGKMPENTEDTNSLMLSRPDILSQSQSATPNALQGLLHLPRDVHKEPITHTSASSKSPPRHSVSCQFSPGEAIVQPPGQHRRSLPYDELSQLLCALQSGPDEGTQSLVRTQLSESEPLNRRDSRFSGHFTAPPTPSGSRRTHGCEEKGKRSAVTYHYIEKANVKIVQGQHSGLCQSEPGNPFRRAVNDEDIPIHLSSMLSEPVEFNSWESSDTINIKHSLPDSIRSPTNTPNLHRAMMDSIAREATSRALAEFGSPQLKRRWAANIRDGSPWCNSWSGSPVVPRSGRTSPSNAQLTYQNQHQSQATDQLSTHVRHLNSTVSSPTNSQTEGIPWHQETPDQHTWKGEESPRQLYRHGPFSPTIMPPAIQHEVPPVTITQAVCNQRFDQKTSKSPRPTHKVNFNFASTSNLSDGGAGKQSLSKSASPAISPELAHKLAEEATKLSRLIEAKRFNSPSPSQLDTAIPHCCSRESHLHASIQSYSAKTVSDSHLPAEGHHSEQEPVETGHLSGHATFHRASLSPVRPARLHLCNIGPTSGMSSCELSKRRIGSEAVLGSQENHLREIGSEGLIEAEQSCVLSQSSSGVTGSLQESTRPEADCNSPETSSQTSQRSSVKGNTGIQLDSGSQLLGPSLHSQKIAHAKWEFLFGKPSGDHPGVKGSSSATSSGYSSEFPTPSPPSSLPPRSTAPTSSHRPSSEYQRSSSHEVQEVEVELVSPVPSSVLGSSPTTGIIRRAIRYSETDLDAVPLRCYRETDIDEVLLAEQEEDSAFSSSRSVPVTSGTSGTSSCSTLETAGWLQADGAGEDEEMPKDEEVASWASVRMQCDKKRQHATHDRDEVFSRLLKCCPSSPTALKSPVSVESPSTTSLDGLDSFSRHFESIMESHRAKGTSYSSLDSEDLTLCGPSVFTFDLPTLTPEIQSQICESTKQIIELSFAPLAQSEAAGLSGSTASEAPQGSAKTRLRGSAKEERESSPPQNHLQPYADSETSQRERSSRPTSFTDPDVTVANGNKGDLLSAKRLAKRLFNLDGFRRSDIMRHLSKNNEFSQMVAEEYLSHFNFSCLSLDQSLRVFLREFALVGETQERERVLSHFSRRYLQCNPNTIPNEDSVHTLTCALMLLNTDLHGNNVGKRMSCRQFISNLEGLNGGQDFPKELLKALYNSIKNEKLQWTIDEEEPRKSFSDLTTSRTDSASHTLKRSGSGAGPLASLAQQVNAQVYKSGFLMRKVHASPGGKKTPRGRRGWKSFYAILKGLVLYLQKGEFRADKQLSDEDLKNAVSIHHSLAMRAADYSKRPNVFYLRTADWRVFLFQAPNAEQMQSWITRINMVAAIFSAPPFPAAIGSQKKFSRPLLPGSSTKLSEEEQVQSHEMRFRAVSSELQELRSIQQELNPRGKELEEYKQREEYLVFEKMRYGTYAMLLRAKIRSGETDLTAFEGWMFAEGGLQRALSSPTLPQDSSGGSSVSKKGFKHSFRQAVKP